MKKIISLMFVFCLAFLVLGCQNVKKTAVVNQEPVKIIIYTSMYEEIITTVRSNLQRQFPGWHIEFVYGGTGLIQQRITAEKQSGRLGCDILMVADPSYSMELKEAGMLHSFRYRDAANLAFDYDPQGYWYPVRVSNMVLAYNPSRSSRNSIPNSFFNFADDTRMAGTISMRNPLVSGTTMVTIAVLLEKYGNGYFDALGWQKPMIDYGAEETIRKLESGESSVAMILEESILRIRQENNSRLEIIYPTDGVVVIPSTVMIVNDRWNANRNAAAAETIAAWFLSMEGQNAIVDGWMHSVRKDVTQLPHGSVPIEQILTNSIPVNWENVFNQRQDIQKRFEESILARR